MSTSARQFMTFKMGDELFAIDVPQVREVLEISAIPLSHKRPSLAQPNAWREVFRPHRGWPEASS